MEILIEDYERRLETVMLMIEEKAYSDPIDIERLKTKAICYRSFVYELKKINTIEKH